MHAVSVADHLPSGWATADPWWVRQDADGSNRFDVRAALHLWARDIFDIPEPIRSELRMMPANVIVAEGYTLLDKNLNMSYGSASPIVNDVDAADGTVLQLYFP